MRKVFIISGNFFLILIGIFFFSITTLSQSNIIIKNLSYEWKTDGLLIIIETEEPSNIVCHAVKNPPSIIITSPDEIFTNQPNIIKIGGVVKSIRAVKGLRKIPEELDPSYYNTSFFVVDLSAPKKFTSNKEDTRFILTVKEDPVKGSKKPFYTHISDLVEKIYPSEEIDKPKKTKKEKPKKQESVEVIKEPKPAKETAREKLSDTKGMRDKEIELALKKLSEKQETAEETNLEDLAKQESKKSVKEDVVLDKKKESAQKTEIGKPVSKEIKEPEKRVDISIAGEKEQKIPESELKPQPSESKTVKKKQAEKDVKRFSKMGEIVEQLSKKEESSIERETQPIAKEIPSKPKKFKPTKGTQETIERLSELKKDLNKAIDDRIQAELLKDNATKKWEESKKELDEVF